MYKDLKKELEKLEMYNQDNMIKILALKNDKDLMMNFLEEEEVVLYNFPSSTVQDVFLVTGCLIKRYYDKLNNKNKIKLLKKASHLSYFVFPKFNGENVDAPTITNLYKSYIELNFNFITFNLNSFYDYMIENFSFIIERASFAKAFDEGNRFNICYYSHEQFEFIIKLIKYKIENYNVTNKEMEELSKTIMFWINNAKTLCVKDEEMIEDILKKFRDYLIENCLSKIIIDRFL